jgi:hypothetical protein
LAHSRAGNLAIRREVAANTRPLLHDKIQMNPNNLTVQKKGGLRGDRGRPFEVHQES